MARVKRGVQARRRHKKVLKQAKGYYNARRKVFRVAKQAVTKALQYAYIGRKQKKRQFRALWIARINAARARQRHELQPLHERPAEGRHHPRPQGAGGHRRARRGGFCRAGRKGEGRAGGLSRCSRDDRRIRAATGSTSDAGEGRKSFPILFCGGPNDARSNRSASSALADIAAAAIARCARSAAGMRCSARAAASPRS